MVTSMIPSDIYFIAKLTFTFPSSITYKIRCIRPTVDGNAYDKI